MMTIKRMLLAAAMVGSSSVGLLLTTENASAVIYCTYIGYPHGCVARPGVRLVARPATVGAVTAPRPGNQ